MSTGKYSPTIVNQPKGWWDLHSDETGLYDVDGYDMYGYNDDGFDRAGNSENDYLTTGDFQPVGEFGGDEWVYTLYDDVYYEWFTYNWLQHSTERMNWI